MKVHSTEADRFIQRLVIVMEPKRGYSFKALMNLVNKHLGSNQPTFAQIRMLVQNRPELRLDPITKRWYRRDDMRIIRNVRTMSWELIDETDLRPGEPARLVHEVSDSTLIMLLLKHKDGGLRI